MVCPTRKKTFPPRSADGNVESKVFFFFAGTARKTLPAGALHAVFVAKKLPRADVSPVMHPFEMNLPD